MQTFRNEAEAQRHAALHRPFSQLNPPDAAYAARYGARARSAAQECAQACLRGDLRALHIHQHALSLVLFADQPQLFASRSAR